VEVVRDRAALAVARVRLPGPIGLVPTMGALHGGHRALIDRARSENEAVVATIFVNPTQFARGEDLARYPRDEPGDLAALEEAGVDLAFVPPVEAIYPEGFATRVDPGPLGSVLEGAARPGHFAGVATVVTILLDLVRPDRSYFGQKDGQQAVIVRRLAHDLALPGEVVVVPTVREPDGLAMSSRNRYLSDDERAAAPALFEALSAASEAYGRGERDADRLRALMSERLAREPLASPDYVSVADAASLEELDRVDRPALASVAVRFASARLIDCLPLGGAAG
jgi:pantoate--beta-alanine ligase